MDWAKFIGHRRQQQWFANAIARNRLASTFLFVGPSGIGKRTFADLVAKTMLCTNNEPSAFQPCCHCEACIQVAANTHPDVIRIHREVDDKTGKEKSELSIDQFVGGKDSRMREGLCYELRMRPYSGRRKIAIIDEVDTLNTEGANSLLKTLEEPPAGSMIFLIGTSEQRQLPTIRSRCQVVRFLPLSNHEVALLLTRLGKTDQTEDSDLIARQSHGSIETAIRLLDTEQAEFRSALRRELLQSPLDFPRLSKSITGHLDTVATEGQPRRERLKWILDQAIDVFRDSMRGNLGLEPDSTSLLPLSPVELSMLIQRTERTREQVDRNISPAPLIEAWTAALSASL